MATEEVVSLAERLKQRREELGISQSQAARELDVARTAYRLWELEAAKPAPDRWRLIARWLGVSVTTMLLAEELLTEDEARQAESVASAFSRSGREWDVAGEARAGDFFEQLRELLAEGVENRDISPSQGRAMHGILGRVAAQSSTLATAPWQGAELRTSLPVDELAPKRARDAFGAIMVDIGAEQRQVALLLLSELVTNSVRHGPRGRHVTIGIFLAAGRERLRAEVADDSERGARVRPRADGGYGLALLAELASRWGAGREDGRNVTWFELDLRQPGSWVSPA